MPYKNPEDQRAYARRHYAANKEAYKERAVAFNKERRQDLSLRIDEIKSGPCADCGGTFPPCAMDFDHLGYAPKEINIADASRKGWAWDRVAAEIEKCELVCANCHRVRTHRRRKDAA